MPRKAYLPTETKRCSSAAEAAKAADTSMGWSTDRHMAVIRLTSLTAGPTTVKKRGGPPGSGSRKDRPSAFLRQGTRQTPAPAACACVTRAQVEDIYSAAAAGGARMTPAQIA